MTHKRLSSVLLICIGLAVTLAMIVVSGLNAPLVTNAREAVSDAFLRASPRQYDPATPVHLIDIDEASLAVYGQWPWPRPYLATLTEKLFDHGAIVVGYDILFAEPDRTASAVGAVPGAGSGNALVVPKTPPDDHDLRFAQSLAMGPTVLGISGANAGAAPDLKAGVSTTGAVPSRALTSFPGTLQNLPALTAPAAGVGSVSLGRLNDGIVRSVPAVTEMGGVLVPAFALELLRVAQGAGGYVLKTTDGSGEVSGGPAQAVAIRVGAAEIPLSGDGHVRVNYSGSKVRPVTSAARLLQVEGIDEALADAIAGKIIIVGSSAQALFDIRATPIEAQVPGMSIHAELIEQVAAGQFLTRPDWARGLEVLAIAVTGLIMTLALLAERPVLGVSAGIILATASVLGSAWAFSAHGQLLSPIFPVLTALLVLLPGASVALLLKERARAAVRARFSYFLPADLVDEIADDPSATLTPKGADRELTVFFADMRQFTTLTEKMPPADVVRYVNVFLGTVSDVLVASGATIDKFMGDAVMAFWNAPLEVPDHRNAALGAIAAVENAIANINADLPAQGLPLIDIAIGINTGIASVGLMGSKDRLSYTCVGDSVTLAARLEGLTRMYGVGNCVADATLIDLPDTQVAIELDVVAVKGRSEAARVYTVVQKTADTELVARKLAEARSHYLARRWDEAEIGFQSIGVLSLQGRALATLAAEYLNRIATFRQNPPVSDWAGAAQATSKR